MNPLDAVPSAARLLCAAGGGSSATLSGAIFAYNHATWYVGEVLALASEYAQDYAGLACRAGLPARGGAGPPGRWPRWPAPQAAANA